MALPRADLPLAVRSDRHGTTTSKVILWRIKRPVACKAIAFLEHNAPHWLIHLTVPRSDDNIGRRFWQAGGGYDRNIMDPVTARQMIDYVHNNPVRRSLVRPPEEWFWSSARWYAGIRPVPLEIDPPMLYSWLWSGEARVGRHF